MTHTIDIFGFMNNYEYIRILKKNEIDERANSFKDKFELQSIDSKKLLNDNKDLLLNAYQNYKKERIKDYHDNIKNFYEKVRLWEIKDCCCGQKLKEYDRFWGCPNYRDTTNAHLTFSKFQEKEFQEKRLTINVRIDSDWSTILLDRCELRNKLNAKALLLFYEANGLEDLRQKYDYNNSLKSISGYESANRNSKKDELEIKEYFEEFFENVLYQVYIKFQVKGQKEKVKIVDLIVSDKSDVYLIEIKRHNNFIEELQLELYHELVQNLMQKNRDTRTLKSLFIVNEYEKSYFPQTRCLHFEKLKLIKNKFELIKSLNTQIYK